MSIENMAFNPADGFRNTVSYPDPETEPQGRDQVQDGLDQIRDYINNILKPGYSSTANGKGASQIGVEDSGGKFSGTDVEAVLLELANIISTHTADLITDADGAHGLKIESGTWTPSLKGATTAGTNTYSQHAGYYYKIGKKVHVEFQLQLSAKDAAMAGVLLVGGLPFFVANAYLPGCSIGTAWNITVPSNSWLSGFAQANEIALNWSPGANHPLPADITNAFLLYGSCDYITN